MTFLHDFTLDELKEEFKQKNLPAFRAKQVYEWITSYSSYEQMTNLPLALREQLKTEYSVRPIEILEKLVSVDGTRKYLYKLHEKNCHFFAK